MKQFIGIDIDQLVVDALDELVITEEAFTKMNAYSQTVSQIAGAHIECGGVMVGEQRDGKTHVTDIILLEDQIVTASTSVFEATPEIFDYALSIDKKIVGMWHSHGNHRVFHSSADDTKLEEVLDNIQFHLPNYLIAQIRKRTLRPSQIRKPGEYLEIIDEPGRSVFQIYFNDENLYGNSPSPIKEVVHKQTNGIPYAFSVVLNKESYENPDAILNPENGRTVYVEAFARHDSLRGGQTRRQNIPLKVEPSEYSATINNIVDEVCEKVTYRRQKLREYVTGKSKGTSEQDEKQERAGTGQSRDKDISYLLSDEDFTIVRQVEQSPEYRAAIRQKMAILISESIVDRELKAMGKDAARRAIKNYSAAEKTGQYTQSGNEQEMRQENEQA